MDSRTDTLITNEKFAERKNIWNKKWNELNPSIHQFKLTNSMHARKTLILLEDYAGLNQHGDAQHFARLFHLKRRYVKEVESVISAYYSDKDEKKLTPDDYKKIIKATVDSILLELKNKIGKNIIYHGDLNALMMVINEETKVDFHQLTFEPMVVSKLS